MSSASSGLRREAQFVVARSHARFLQDVWRGLGTEPRWLDSKYLYDDAGSRLFDAITLTPEYYLTRCELSILRDEARAIGDLLGPGCAVIAPGGASGLKLRALLEGFEAPVAAVIVDLFDPVRDQSPLSPAHPDLPLFRLNTDFSLPVALPPLPEARRRVVFFGGSTLGNFVPKQAAGLLRHFASWAGADGRILVGTDLPKAPSSLIRAYDDAAGLTAAFNLNLLRRINRDLGGDFDLERFSHRVRWNGAESRIEMHLRSDVAQSVRIAERSFSFGRFETIHTENAYKWSFIDFERLAKCAGLRVIGRWTDSQNRYALQLLESR
jgi:dimethylhistidine N-methyltransferase